MRAAQTGKENKVHAIFKTSKTPPNTDNSNYYFQVLALYFLKLNILSFI